MFYPPQSSDPVWNTRYFEQAQTVLIQQGVLVPKEVWQHISPLQWAHIHLNGSYRFTDITLEGDFRPLREYHGSRALPSSSSEGTETASVPVSEEDTPPVQLSLLDEEEKDQ
jgi:hypothetical protein